MPKNSIHVQTQTKENYKSTKKISSKQWKIYYYLLSVSKFDSNRVEEHRYIYRKDFNISKCCRELGIKSNQTFYNALKTLQEYNLVHYNKDYFKLYSTNWIDINQNVLTNLVRYASSENETTKRDKHIDLLRTYLILKKLDMIAVNAEERSFTKRQLIILLGHNETDKEQYAQIRIYLALLMYWGLIEIKSHTHYDEAIGKYTVYHLQKVNELPINSDFEDDITGEMKAPLASDKIMNELEMAFPQIINDVA